MNIRIAEEKDIPKILDLLTQVNMVHHNGRPDLFNGPAQKYTKDQLLSMFQKKEDPIFVGTDEQDEVLGYAMCQTQQVLGDTIRTEIKTLYLDDLCVDENARGQHVGSQLYQYLLKYAKEEGYYNLTLHVWECNKSAAKFYEACGMKPQYTCLEQIL